MKILIYSPAFYPNVGGLEMLVEILAHGFVHEGHEVKVVTQTSARKPDTFLFEVVRQPKASQLVNLVSWSEIYFQPNISLRGLWPLALLRRPWVVSHNNWYTRANGKLGWQDRLKHSLVRYATGISVSKAVAEHVKTPSVIIPNAYREDVFRIVPGIEREHDLVFAGRLVSDKGADLLLEALCELKRRGLAPRLTIAGGGPEEQALRDQALASGIADQVSFVGVKRSQELAELLNAHHILVVPSIWREPFGIVALEGIACGCVIVGSESGGLTDAIGPCGVTFPNGDAVALADSLAELLSDPQKLASFRTDAEEHLAKHRPSKVSCAYLAVFESARQRCSTTTPAESTARAKARPAN